MLDPTRAGNLGLAFSPATPCCSDCIRLRRRTTPAAVFPPLAPSGRCCRAPARHHGPLASSSSP
eukprot:scaffold5472_cov140-Isochrysis_galbana.AAC.1